MEKTAEIYTTREKQHCWSKMAHSGNLVDNYRFSFNGQEKDDEITGVTGSHLNFKFRIYDSRIGRFMSVDPLTKDYPYWTPYQFAGNMPIRFLELEGLEPGEPFETKTKAALNFSSIYGKFSIQENREYTATIYSYVDKDGTIKYTYNNPKRGTKESAPNNKARKREGTNEAGIHSHGAFDSDFIDEDGVDWNNQFSDELGDKDVSRMNGFPEYVTTPNGTLQKFDPATETESVVSKDSPSDPNDPSKVNSNYAIPSNMSKKETRQSRREFSKTNRETRKEYAKQYKEILKTRE